MSYPAKQGEPLEFAAHYVNSGVNATGLTVTVEVYRNATKVVTGASATELGDGVYTYTLAGATVTANGNYYAVFNTAGTVDQTNLASFWYVNGGSLGAIEFTYTVTDSGSGDPIAGVTVEISTDLAGTNIVWSGVTDSFGIAKDTSTTEKPFLQAGTYYFWSYKAAYTFTNPDTEVVS